MGMKLAEVMKQGKPPSTADYGGHLLEGAVGPDTHEGYFRVYPNGNVKNRYFVVRSEDVAGDIYKWSDAELAHAGIVGQERYRITIKEGAVIHSGRRSHFSPWQHPKRPGSIAKISETGDVSLLRRLPRQPNSVHRKL